MSSGNACYSGHLFGDAFPNSEVFVINSQKQAQMLRTFQTTGDSNSGPIHFLPGNNNRDMGSFTGVCISQINIVEDIVMVDGSRDVMVMHKRPVLRWLAAGTGLVMVLPCLGITVFYVVLPAVLILGAVIAGWRPLLGKWLIGIGASLLSVLVFPWCVAILFHPGGRVDFMVAACLASAILLPLCDLALLLDVFKGRGGKRLSNLSGV